MGHVQIKPNMRSELTVLSHNRAIHMRPKKREWALAYKSKRSSLYGRFFSDTLSYRNQTWLIGRLSELKKPPASCPFHNQTAILPLETIRSLRKRNELDMTRQASIFVSCEAL